MGLEDKTVVVTGAASGIGRASAHRLAAEGASVAVTDIDSESGRESAESITQSGGTAEFLELDVSDLELFEQTIDEVDETFGSVDVLVNNAGTELFDDFIATSEEDLRETIDTNLIGVWNGCKAVLPKMMDARGGSVINMSSTAGLVGIQNQVAYGMTKAAIASLSQSLATEMGPFGIRVNAIAPGAIETPMISEQVLERTPTPDEVRKRFEKESVFNRLGKPEEIASCVAFLASEEASFLTGEVLKVDGGGTHLHFSYG